MMIKSPTPSRKTDTSFADKPGFEFTRGSKELSFAKFGKRSVNTHHRLARLIAMVIGHQYCHRERDSLGSQRFTATVYGRDCRYVASTHAEEADA